MNCCVVFFSWTVRFRPIFGGFWWPPDCSWEDRTLHVWLPGVLRKYKRYQKTLAGSSLVPVSEPVSLFCRNKLCCKVPWWSLRGHWHIALQKCFRRDEAFVHPESWSKIIKDQGFDHKEDEGWDDASPLLAARCGYAAGLWCHLECDLSRLKPPEIDRNSMLPSCGLRCS